VNEAEKIGERMNNTLTLLDVGKAMSKVKDILANGLPEGLTTGWPVLDPYFKFPPIGQLNLVTGSPGSGKSEILDSLAINMMKKYKWKVFVYSPENYPAEFHLQKLCEKLANKPFSGDYNSYEIMTQKDLDKWEKVLKERFVFADCHMNIGTVDKVLNTIFDECMENKIDMAIIDPWNKLESNKPKGISNTDFIGAALTRIQMFAREKGISFWIVAHPAKPKKLANGKNCSISLYDVSDSSHWYNMIDNGFIVSRQWADKAGTDNLTNFRIAKIKDRRYGKCGDVTFRFRPASGRFEGVDLATGETSL